MRQANEPVGTGTFQGVVLITGGGRGIGAATALLAAPRGHAVCVNYRQRREEAETSAWHLLRAAPPPEN